MTRTIVTTILCVMTLPAMANSPADQALVVTSMVDRHGQPCRVAHSEEVPAHDALNRCVLARRIGQ